jgi:hypothetical protein
LFGKSMAGVSLTPLTVVIACWYCLIDFGAAVHFMVAVLFDQSEDFRMISFTVVNDINDVCCSSRCECICSGDMFCRRLWGRMLVLSTLKVAGVTCCCGCWSLVSLDLRFWGVGPRIQAEGSAGGSSTLVV